MNLERTLDRIHSRTVHIRLLQLFTSFLRVLLALAFIPPSIPKITHQPFTLLPPENPVGAYFAALFDTGYYYEFLGWSQLAAALLLILPRTSHIGALLFLPIIVNITVLTNSVGFKGTWLITILMSIACVYLVCWDYPRWKSVLFSRRMAGSRFSAGEFVFIPLLFGTGGASVLLFFGLITGEKRMMRPSLLAFWFVIGLGFGTLVAIHHRYMKFETANVGPLNEQQRSHQ